MRKLKKLPSKQLEKFSNVFTQLGLVLVLFVVYVVLEYETEDKQIVIAFYDATERVFVTNEQDVIFRKEPKLVEPKMAQTKLQPQLLDEIKKGDNEIVQTLFNEPKKPEPLVLDLGTLVVVENPTDKNIDEDVPFLLIEDAPIFQGCEGLSKEKNKACFAKKINQFIQRNFDGDLAQELGLSAGKKRISTQFIIDKNGDIIEVQVRAPHPKLQAEAQRIIAKLPKFTPGKQRGNAVKVKYTLPISFEVQ